MSTTLAFPPSIDAHHTHQPLPCTSHHRRPLQSWNSFTFPFRVFTPPFFLSPVLVQASLFPFFNFPSCRSDTVCCFGILILLLTPHLIISPFHPICCCLILFSCLLFLDDFPFFLSLLVLFVSLFSFHPVPNQGQFGTPNHHTVTLLFNPLMCSRNNPPKTNSPYRGKSTTRHIHKTFCIHGRAGQRQRRQENGDLARRGRGGGCGQQRLYFGCNESMIARFWELFDDEEEEDPSAAL